MLFKKILILSFLLTTTTLMAATSIQAIDEAFDRGELTPDEMILNKIYALLDPELVDSQFIVEQAIPHKCGTPILMQYEALLPELSESTRATIDGYLINTTRDLRSTYLSPGGHFTFDYSTSGTDAVSATDVNNNGVPDYVERAATYLDYTWAREVDSAGFAGPNHVGGDGRYNVSFENLGSGFYGYCSASGVDGSELTHLVLSSTFSGMGPNHDPQGNVIGAMKVTAAHEFKHASQRVHSNWSEGGWVELDATWAEEYVYDYVNDSMINFMGSGDPFSHPHYGLDHGGTGSYEDYAWQDFIHQRFEGNSYASAPVIKDFWTWRETHTSQSVMESYDHVLSEYGSSLAEAFGEYVVWNFFTGSRAIMSGGVSQFGYDDAGISGFPTATLAATHSSYPASRSLSGIENLGAKMVRLNPGSTNGLEIVFDGQDGVEMSAMWAVQNSDNSVDWGRIDLDANNDGSEVLDMSNAVMAALIPVVTQITGSSYSVNYTVDLNTLTQCDPGDLDDSGVQDVSDLVRLVAVILGNGAPPNDIELCAGDVNADDNISIGDVVTLVDIILE